MPCSVAKAALDARAAFKAYQTKTLKERTLLIDAIRRVLSTQIDNIAEQTLAETGMGVLEDKKKKLVLAIEQTPGVEDLTTDVVTNDDGMTLYEYSPYGVVCAVHPSTNPAAMLINTTISALAAGDAIIHSAHPRAFKVSTYIASLINTTCKEVLGIDNLVTILSDCSCATTEELMNHPDVDMIIMTGSSTAVSHAFRADKKVIGAGPANPPVIVDESADLDCAAKSIVDSASFDNNLMCVTEKAIIAVEKIAGPLMMKMSKYGAQILSDEEDVTKLTQAIFTMDYQPRKIFDGRNASDILTAAGIQPEQDVRLAVPCTIAEHPFTTFELKMPLVPFITVADFDEALETALAVEQGYHHTAAMHSCNLEHLNRAAKVMQTSVFIKNGPAYNAIGMGIDAPASFAVASRTGEGTVTARNFARRRRCCLNGAFVIR